MWALENKNLEEQGRNAKTARNLEIFRTDVPTDTARCSRVSATKKMDRDEIDKQKNLQGWIHARQLQMVGQGQ